MDLEFVNKLKQKTQEAKKQIELNISNEKIKKINAKKEMYKNFIDIELKNILIDQASQGNSSFKLDGSKIDPNMLLSDVDYFLELFNLNGSLEVSFHSYDYIEYEDEYNEDDTTIGYFYFNW